MTIRWINEQLGTAPATEVRDIAGIEIVDVRDLVDKAGNRTDAIREKILTGVQHLRNGCKTVVCCDYGISRSNAIAAGIIALHDQIPFLDAVRLVQSRTGETEIKLDPLDAVRRAIEDASPASPSADKRTVLVTGARGFIGAALCRQLVSQFDVVAPSREQLDIELGSTQLSLLAAQHGVDCIIHLAHPRVFTSNIALGKALTMLRNVLEVCATQGISLIYPSGSEIYSGYTGSILASESVPVFPSGPNGETKHLAETLIEHWRQNNHLNCAVVRSSPVYGADGQKPKFLFNFIEKARRSETIVTHRYLNGDAALDLLHIDDFVDAIVRTCVQNYVGTINVGTGTVTSTFVIAEMLRNELGSSSRIEQIQVETHTACVAMNYQKANRTLGWCPKINLQEGLRSLLRDHS